MKKISRSTRGSRAPSARPPSAVASVLADLARAAASRRLRWYLFGAQAVAIYGVPRTSADIDVTVEASIEALVPAMERAGFELRVPDAERFVAATRVLPFEHTRSGWPVDAVLAGPGLEEMFLASARRVRVGRRSVPVIAPEHLIVTKVLAGRPKDLEDVRGLLRQQHLDLDVKQIRDLLRTIEAALDRADLVPLLARLVAEARDAGER